MWFILFSPGLGGNHLLNIVNTDPAMEADIDFVMSRYQPEVNTSFAICDTEHHFHHSPGSNHAIKLVHNFQDLPTPEVRAFFEKNKAGCAHLAEYVNLYKNADTSTHRQIIIDLPTNRRSDNLAWQRWISYSLKMLYPRRKGKKVTEFDFEDVAWLQHEYLWYGNEIFDRLVPQNDVFRIPSELVFSRYGDTVCEWFFDNTDIKPNPELVRTMQAQFFEETSKQVQDRLERYIEANNAPFNRYDD